MSLYQILDNTNQAVGHGGLGGMDPRVHAWGGGGMDPRVHAWGGGGT